LFDTAASGGTSRSDILSATWEEDAKMLLWILLIIIVIIVFGLGFVVKALFWVALALFILWLIALLIGLFRR
jgi:hypothetical protein